MFTEILTWKSLSEKLSVQIDNAQLGFRIYRVDQAAFWQCNTGVPHFDDLAFHTRQLPCLITDNYSNTLQWQNREVPVFAHLIDLT